MRLVTALVIAAIFSGAALVSHWSKPDPAGEVVIQGPSPGDAELVKAAMQVFEKNCPDLFGSYRGAVEKISARVIRDSSWADDRGWNRRSISVWIKLTADAEGMPAAWHAGGETLFYSFGAGSDPGIAATLDLSQLACGMPIASFEHPTTYKSVPEMGFIDAVP